jgi:hypothetical protein
MNALLGLLLAASFDGGAALRHASALAALGPHPWGSPRNQAAAQYVANEMRAAGLQVELQPFEHAGIAGTNVVATLPAPGEDFVVIGAHHDTAPDSPGAYDDGGGVGILLELARVLAPEAGRPRTLVFVSFDGEEAWATQKGTTVGSRAYVERLGPRARSLVAAFVIEMSGWSGGRPLLHPLPYVDPRESGRTVVAPAWLVRDALLGSREAGSPLGVGDPYIPWLYQAGVRTFRVRLYGDDLSFLQAGLPAVFASDSSFSAFYPAYHQASDVAERLDAAALDRMGRAALGVVRTLERVPRTREEGRDWFAALGRVFTRGWLLALGALSLLPGLRRGLSASAAATVARLVQAGLSLVLFWLVPVPALWVLLLPNALPPLRRRAWSVGLSLLPFASLIALGVAAWWRGAVNGVWLGPWEWVLLILALTLAFAGLGPGTKRPAGRGRKERKRSRR